MKADKKFENDCLDYFQWAERRDLATANRYGVQGSFIQHKEECSTIRNLTNSEFFFFASGVGVVL